LALDRDKTLQAAQEFVDRKRYDKALVEYEKVIKADPNDTRTLLKIGDVQAKSANFVLAIKTYDRVATYYSEQGFSLKAIAVYKQVRELIHRHAPLEADRYTHVVKRLVASYAELGLLNDALNALDEEANRLRAAGREDDAIGVYRQMTQVGGGAPIAHLRLAEGLCRTNEIALAMTSFWTAAQLLVQAGRKDDALRVLERMLHFKQVPTYAKLAARLYLQKGTEAEGMVALSRLQACFQADPHDLETLELLAQAFHLIGQEPKALEVKKEIAQQAYEQEQPELFATTLAELIELAPEDEQVLALRHLAATKLDGPSRDNGTGGSGPPRSQPASFETRTPSSLSMEVDLTEELAMDELGVESSSVPQPPRAAVDDEELAEVRAHTRKALVDAETFRDLSLGDKAVETIQVALEFDPRSIELREMLRDLYAEYGNFDGAVDEMLTMAAIYMEYGRPDHARTVLENILEAQPGHAAATQMRHQLDAGGPEAATAEGLDDSLRLSGRPTPVDTLDMSSAAEAASEEFGEFDLTDLGRASSWPPRPSSSPPQPPPSPAASRPAHAPPPTDEAEAIGAAPLSQRSASNAVPGFEVEAGSRTTQSLEDGLEEVEFFINSGLYDDARSVLEEQLERNPGHPLLLMAQGDLAASELSSSTFQFGHPLPAVEGAPLAEGAEAFDLQQSLGELERAVRESQSPPAGGAPVDVESVFEKFKAGVKRRVAENDSSTHFELGVAYKQMNLLDDAILELELASKDDLHECACYAVIGSIYVENELWAQASKALSRALNAVQRTAEQETSLYYDLGHVAEQSGNGDQAAYYFQQALRRNPQYRDAKQRLERARESARPSIAIKAQVDEDLDRAFDDLLGD
jgi:tetratricopeptide (TPR) repeat protein